MAAIGLVVREGVEAARILARELLVWCESRGHRVILEAKTASLLQLPGGVPSTQVATSAHAIVTLGGDGTLIGVARYVADPGTVLVGVNFGTLGFLTEIAPTELLGVLEDFFEGRCKLATRAILTAEVQRGASTIFSQRAVNDAVVQKGTQDPLIDLDFSVDGEPVMRIRADGLILSTPTGSTAYSLAAGGSIVYPHLDAVLVTPICAHSLTSRPLILPIEAVLEVGIPPHDGAVYLSIDGQVSFELLVGDVVRVTRAEFPVRFVRSPTRSYFEILRRKLNWGIANQSGC